jgi:TPR repeat protein
MLIEWAGGQSAGGDSVVIQRDGGQETTPTHDMYTEAAALLRDAASAGIPQAFHYQGVLYEYGLGVPQDFAVAMSNYERAAELQYVESMYHLALMYAYGRGCVQDHRRALSLFEAGAVTEHAPSAYYMGIYRMYGYGCEPNYNQALTWFERAGSLDDPRVSAKAAAAAAELRQLIEEANEQNEEMLNELRKRSEVSGADSDSA